MNKYIIILITLSLNSCFLSKPNRANRKLKKAIELNPNILNSDTIYIKDTIIVESYKIDTLREFITHDTVTVINNERVSLKYFYDTTRLEIWHDVECKKDTVILTNTIIKEKFLEKDSNNSNILTILLMICLSFLLFICFKVGFS